MKWQNDALLIAYWYNTNASHWMCQHSWTMPSPMYYYIRDFLLLDRCTSASSVSVVLSPRSARARFGFSGIGKCPASSLMAILEGASGFDPRETRPELERIDFQSPSKSDLSFPYVQSNSTDPSQIRRVALRSTFLSLCFFDVVSVSSACE